ncbi:HAD family hydrolase [Mastigocladus laminosus UU774]|nr:HAD family hydrolase [Mastigocladus laminosus UU774]
MSYQVVHSTFGRYRIRIPQLARDSDFASKLKTLVESLAFVTEVRINAKASSLIVSYQDDVCSTMALEKFVGCIQVVDCVEIPLTESLPEGEDLKPEVNQWKDLGFPVLSLSLALLAAPLELPPLIVVLAIAGAATPWFNRAADSLLNQRQPNIDLLDSAWMTMQAVQGQFIAPSLKTVLVEVRRTLRGNTIQTIEEQSLNLLNQLDQYVWVELDGKEQHIHISNLHQGDRIIIKSGEMILVDGIVLYGYGLVDCQNLTGSSTPVVCSRGYDIYASTILLEGELCVLVKRIGINTRAGLATLLAELALVHDTKIGAFQAEFVKNAILPTLALGGTIYLMTGNIGAAISPYQFDFGSGIPISISTTVLQALIYAVRHGIYIRSGAILEALAEIDAIVFDIKALALDSPETLEAITILQHQNIEIYLVCDAPESMAVDVATQLGIHPYQVCTEPLTQKINLIRGLRHQGKTVAFVGDEKDDAAELAHANVSISFAKTSEIPHTTTDVVILEDDLRGVTHAIAIAKRAMEMIYQNTATIVIPNLFMQIGGGMVLGVNPVYNVIVNNSTAFVAEFINGSRPLFETNFLPPLRSNRGNIEQYSSSNGKALKQGELAKRLGVSPQSLTNKRLKPEFPIWTQARDPEGIAWDFDPVAKRYRHSPA